MTNHKKLLIAILASLPLIANATLTQKGAPSAPISKMSAYGVAVPIQTGLPSLVPSGWDIMVAEDVKLPADISWDNSDSWVSALEKFSNNNKLHTTVDWTNRSVAIRNISLKDAAITPIPVYEPAPVEVAKKEEKVQLASSSSMPVAPKKQLKSVKPVAVSPVKVEAIAPVEEVRVEVKPVSSAIVIPPKKEAAKFDPIPESSAIPKKLAEDKPSDFNYYDAKAINKFSVRSVAQGIANRHGLRLVYLANEEKVKGPVTLLGKSAQEDVKLLNNAIGLYSPVKVRLEGKEVIVFDSTDSTSATAIAAQSNKGSILSKGDSIVDSSTAKLKSFDSKKMEVPLISFDLAAGDAVEDKLVDFAKKNGYTLEWIVPGGFEANHAYHYEGSSVKNILNDVLTPLSLSADIYKKDMHIVVRPGNLTSSR